MLVPHARSISAAPYRGAVESSRRSTITAVLVYTLLRLALFLVVWAVIAFLTPIKGGWAAAAAIVMSGAISLVVLDRQRGAVGSVAAGFFGRINARIEASARAEDDDSRGDELASGDAEQYSEQHAVDQEKEPGLLERRDEPGSDRA